MKQVKLLTRSNTKLKKTDKLMGTRTMTFSLPYEKTCPQASECIKDNGEYPCMWKKLYKAYPQLPQARERNFIASKRKDFWRMLANQINSMRIKPTHVRMHDEGDIYNTTYLNQWITLARTMPNITFYAYTKSVSLVKSAKHNIPSNMRIIFSFGGKEDHLIDVRRDPHAIVIDESMVNFFSKRGYMLGNDNDHAMLMGYDKIMLIKH